MYNLKDLDASVVTGPDGLISVGPAAPGKAQGLTDEKAATLVLANAARIAEENEQDKRGTQDASHPGNKVKGLSQVNSTNDAILKNYASVSFPLDAGLGGGFEQIAIANADENDPLWTVVKSTALKLPQNSRA